MSGLSKYLARLHQCIFHLNIGNWFYIIHFDWSFASCSTSFVLDKVFIAFMVRSRGGCFVIIGLTLLSCSAAVILKIKMGNRMCYFVNIFYILPISRLISCIWVMNYRYVTVLLSGYTNTIPKTWNRVFLEYSTHPPYLQGRKVDTHTRFWHTNLKIF